MDFAKIMGVVVDSLDAPRVWGTNMLRDAPLVFERLQAKAPQAVDLMGRLVERAGGTD